MTEATNLYKQADVERGAKLLDEKNPGWTDKIDLETLDLELGTACVLGQLYGDWSKGATPLGLTWDWDTMETYGFYTSEWTDEAWAGLNYTWKQLIQERRVNDQLL